MSAYSRKAMYSVYPSVSDVCRAAAEGDVTLLKILIGRRAPVDSVCDPVYVRGGKHLISGWPPIRVAARYAQYRVLQLLLGLDSVDPNRASLDDGRTALHDAVELGNLLIVDMLLKAGSDPLLRDFNGQNSLDIARAERNTTVLEILLEAVSQPSRGISCGSSYSKDPPDYSLEVGAVNGGQLLKPTTLASEDNLRPPLRDNFMKEKPSFVKPYPSTLDDIDSPSPAFVTTLSNRQSGYSGTGRPLGFQIPPTSDKDSSSEQTSLQDMKLQIEQLRSDMNRVLQIVEYFGSGRMSKMEKVEDPEKSNEFPVPTLLRNSRYLARYPVPVDKKPWDVDYPGYAPILFSDTSLYTKTRESTSAKEAFMALVRKENGYENRMCYYPPIWADPEILGMSPEDRNRFFKFNAKSLVAYHPFHGPSDKEVEINRISYLGEYKIDPITGVPLNPSGRTGMVGRGLLGKYGPNHAADPVVTCLSESSGDSATVLKLALICRQDTKQYALPGGMVDPGENELSSTAIREFCEEAIEGNNASGSSEEKKQRRAEMVKRFVQHKKMDQPIISKVVDDPRNTDNAWMETQAFWFHFLSESDLGRKLEAGDDAVGAQWVTLNEDFDVKVLYADHSSIVIQLFKAILNDPDTSKDFPGLVVPSSIKSKL